MDTAIEASSENSSRAIIQTVDEEEAEKRYGTINAISNHNGFRTNSIPDLFYCTGYYNLTSCVQHVSH